MRTGGNAIVAAGTCEEKVHLAEGKRWADEVGSAPLYSCLGVINSSFHRPVHAQPEKAAAVELSIVAFIF